MGSQTRAESLPTVTRAEALRALSDLSDQSYQASYILTYHYIDITVLPKPNTQTHTQGQNHHFLILVPKTPPGPKLQIIKSDKMIIFCKFLCLIISAVKYRFPVCILPVS